MGRTKKRLASQSYVGRKTPKLDESQSMKYKPRQPTASSPNSVSGLE